MRPFEDLTASGQARRLRLFAQQALIEHYGFRAPSVRLVSAHSFNTVFRVDADGQRFALRIGDSTRIHPMGVEDAESAWLARLHEDGFGTARITPTTNGQRWVEMNHADVSGPRVCTLFSWVRGRELGRSTSAADISRAGQLMARLHEHSTGLSIEPPAAVRAERAIYFADDDMVASHPHPERSLFVEATERVQTHTDELWRTNPTEPRLLHGDFGPHNILRYRQHLVSIDFQDLIYGFPEQDLGITLTDLARESSELTDDFLRGYGQVAEPPDLSPTLLGLYGAARSLNVMNLALHAPHRRIARAFDAHAALVSKWMRGRHN